MCGFKRRDFLKGSTAMLGSLIVASPGGVVSFTEESDIGKVDHIAPDVFFHVGDLSRGLCNNGWVIFEDYVLVIDANFPLGAQELLPKIRAVTDKPVRFAFDTHHHGDHAYGNQTWVENGATPPGPHWSH